MGNDGIGTGVLSTSCRHHSILGYGLICHNKTMFPSSFASSTIARTMLIKRAVRTARSFNRAVAVSEVLMVDSRRRAIICSKICSLPLQHSPEIRKQCRSSRDAYQYIQHPSVHKRTYMPTRNMLCMTKKSIVPTFNRYVMFCRD